ncbi:VQ motif-containing protein 9-like [Phaseolus vulgaris]|uniref:VQ domain-containing protein n=1 Tax=Phaseolus vulgaris TaxID=3885 RepID=V7B640_PHAVU|nr:hypothetical protein PHAVU_008G162700g [Phaseolus vulgaris]ESW13040.1 hypothetical protein PHAVU_008G162700g [Phaseolus vulgaris]
MDQKNYESSSSISSTSMRDQCLKQLNKLSHNISKPNVKKSTFDSLTDSPPKVYNISKNDFRDMVQMLTGSPGHNHQPKQVATSRLHRLRPPPLPQVLRHRPPLHPVAAAPPSPLPPFPSVHTESPVSAYLRFLRNPMPSSSSQSEFQIPASPVTFGCLNSVSHIPLSPTMPVSNRDL